MGRHPAYFEDMNQGIWHKVFISHKIHKISISFVTHVVKLEESIIYVPLQCIENVTLFAKIRIGCPDCFCQKMLHWTFNREDLLHVVEN